MTRSAFALALLGATLLAARPSRASTIDTFSFSQGGYVDPNFPGQTGVLGLALLVLGFVRGPERSVP